MTQALPFETPVRTKMKAAAEEISTHISTTAEQLKKNVKCKTTDYGHAIVIDTNLYAGENVVNGKREPTTLRIVVGDAGSSPSIHLQGGSRNFMPARPAFDSLAAHVHAAIATAVSAISKPLVNG